MTSDKSIISMIEKEAEGLYKIRGRAEYESLEEYDNFRSRQLARQFAYIAGRSKGIESLIEESEQYELWENLQDIINDHFNGDSIISSACIELLSSKYLLIKK